MPALVAFSMVLIVEGLLYALFPDLVRKFMAQALSIPPETMRLAGVGAVLTGFTVLVALRWAPLIFFGDCTILSRSFIECRSPAPKNPYRKEG